MKMIEKYDTRAEAANSLLCVGLDPNPEKIPLRFKTLTRPQFEFNKWIIDETHEYAAAYKPNSAFYEACGSKGIEELKMTFDYLHERYPDLYTIVDAKRADIGNTNMGYAAFIFDWLGADAITVNPYLGKEALEPFLARKDKGVAVLAYTSNPGSKEIQGLLVDGRPLWEIVTEKVAREWNDNGNCMLAVGATHPSEFKTIRALAGDMTLLVPGVGAQGGEVKTMVEHGKNSKGKGLIINSSRGIIFSENPKQEALKLRDEINSYRS